NVCPCSKLGAPMRRPVSYRRHVGMTSSHQAPYDLGYTRATRDCTTRSKPAKASGSLKAVLSSDCRLHLAYTKLESLVIADQHAAVNTFPGLVHTARHTMRVCNTQSLWDNLYRSQPSKVGQMIRVKS